MRAWTSAETRRTDRAVGGRSRAELIERDGGLSIMGLSGRAAEIVERHENPWHRRTLSMPQLGTWGSLT